MNQHLRTSIGVVTLLLAATVSVNEVNAQSIYETNSGWHIVQSQPLQFQPLYDATSTSSTSLGIPFGDNCKPNLPAAFLRFTLLRFSFLQFSLAAVTKPFVVATVFSTKHAGRGSESDLSRRHVRTNAAGQFANLRRQSRKRDQLPTRWYLRGPLTT